MPFKKKIKEGESEESKESKYSYPITGLNQLKGYLNARIKDINTPPNVAVQIADRLALYGSKDKETADKIERMFFGEGKKPFKIIEEAEKQVEDPTLKFLEEKTNGIQS